MDKIHVRYNYKLEHVLINDRYGEYNEFLNPAISEDLEWSVRNILRLISTKELISRKIFTVIKAFKDLFVYMDAYLKLRV